MGLDITAHGSIHRDTRLQEEREREGDLLTQHLGVSIHPAVLDWTQKEFPRAADDLKAGEYLCSGSRLSFRAGSYSGYGEWRDWLARISGWASPQECWAKAQEGAEGPFMELIHFADNEGYIGPHAAAKLAADFETFRPRAKAHAEDEWNLALYDRWWAAFQIAAEGGVVEFH
jgi:hypothetical protein